MLINFLIIDFIGHVAIAIFKCVILKAIPNETVHESDVACDLNEHLFKPYLYKLCSFKYFVIAYFSECLEMKHRGQKHHVDVIAVMSTTAKVNHILGEKINDRRKQEKRKSQAVNKDRTSRFLAMVCSEIRCQACIPHRYPHRLPTEHGVMKPYGLPTRLPQDFGPTQLL